MKSAPQENEILRAELIRQTGCRPEEIDRLMKTGKPVSNPLREHVFQDLFAEQKRGEVLWGLIYGKPNMN